MMALEPQIRVALLHEGALQRIIQAGPPAVTSDHPIGLNAERRPGAIKPLYEQFALRSRPNAANFVLKPPFGPRRLGVFK